MKDGWDYFAASVEEPTRVFEQTVARRLFAREVGVTSAALRLPPNLAGVESEPVQFNGEWVSFQAKFAADRKTPWSDFERAISKATQRKSDDYFKLDRIHLYTNGSPGAGGNGLHHASQVAISQVADEAGVALTWHFGDQVLEDAATAPDILGLFRNDFPRFRTPDLINDHAMVKGADFIGREHELRQLLAFVDSDEQFSWLSIGGRAGAGKTRLLQKLRDRVPSDWSLVWMGSGIERLRPDHVTGPLVIVIDGPLAYGMDALREDLEALAAHQPPSRLRIAIVDRDPRRWEPELVAGATNRSADFRYDDPLFLDTMRGGEWIELIRATAMTLELPVQEAVDEYSDKQGVTPLELILQLSTQSTESTEAIRSLLNDWRHSHYPVASDAVLDAAAAITIARECGPRDFEQSPEIEAVLSGATSTSEVLAVLGHDGVSSGFGFLRGIEPDLVGELFVLDHWSRTPFAPTPPSLGSALQISKPGAVADFFDRAGANYPTHPALGCLGRPSPIAESAPTWALCQSVAAGHLHKQNPSLAQDVLTAVGDHGDEALTFQCLLRILLAQSDRASRSFDRSTLAAFDDPSVRIRIGLPGGRAPGADGDLFHEEYLAWFVSALDSLEIKPVAPIPMIVQHLHDELAHAGLTVKDPERYERAVRLLREYADIASARGEPIPDLVASACETGVIAAQHLVDRDQRWAEAAIALFEDLASIDSERSLGKAAGAIIRALGDSPEADDLVGRLRANASHPEGQTQFLSALVNYSARLRAGSERIGQVFSDLQVASAESPTTFDIDNIQMASSNLYGKLATNDSEILCDRMADFLIHDKEQSGDGVMGTVRELGSRARRAIDARDCPLAQRLLDALRAISTDDRKSQVEWAISGTFEALNNDQLGQSDFAASWQVLKPFWHELPPNRLDLVVNEWFGIIMRTKTFTGSRRDAFDDLAGEASHGVSLLEAIREAERRHNGGL